MKYVMCLVASVLANPILLDLIATDVLLDSSTSPIARVSESILYLPFKLAACKKGAAICPKCPL